MNNIFTFTNALYPLRLRPMIRDISLGSELMSYKVMMQVSNKAKSIESLPRQGD